MTTTQPHQVTADHDRMGITECETRFGTHPMHEWNTTVHVQQAESNPNRRAFTLDELQSLFDHAGGQVARIRPAGRKGWLRRSATIAYGYGLRRNETRMLDAPTSAPTRNRPSSASAGSAASATARR